jgi:F-type H+-transporting ATPase subunit b
MEDFLSFVTIDKWEIIFTWGNLLILFLLMKKILFKPVKAILDKREKEINSIYDDAKKASDSAEKLKEEYTEKLSKAKEDAEEIVRSATKKAQLTEEELMQNARMKAEKIVERAEEQIQLEKQNAVNEVKNEISDIAVSLASEIIKKEISEDKQHEIIDGLIKDSENDNTDVGGISK